MQTYNQGAEVRWTVSWQTESENMIFHQEKKTRAVESEWIITCLHTPNFGCVVDDITEDHFTQTNRPHEGAFPGNLLNGSHLKHQKNTPLLLEEMCLCKVTESQITVTDYNQAIVKSSSPSFRHCLQIKLLSFFRGFQREPYRGLSSCSLCLLLNFNFVNFMGVWGSGFACDESSRVLYLCTSLIIKTITTNTWNLS